MRRLTLFFALAGTAFSLAAAEVAAPAAPAVPEVPKAPEAQVKTQVCKDAPAKKVTANRRRLQFGRRDGQRGMQFGNRRQMMMRNRRQMMMRGNNNNCCCCCCCKRGNGEAGFQRPVRRDGKMDFRRGNFRRGNFRRGDMKNFGPNRNRRFKKDVPQTIPAKNVKPEVPAPAAPAVPAAPAAPAVPAVESK